MSSDSENGKRNDGGSKTSANLIDLDRARAFKVQREKAAASAIDLLKKGTAFDKALEQTVKGKKLDTVGENCVRAQMLTFNLGRAVARVRKQLVNDPTQNLEALSKLAADKFSVRANLVKNAVETQIARELVLSFLATTKDGEAAIKLITSETGLTEDKAKATVDSKTVFRHKLKGEWYLGTSAKPDKTEKELVVDYLKEHGNAFIKDVMNGTELSEKAVKAQVDKQTIFWIEKVGGQWIIGLDSKDRDRPGDGRPVIDVTPDSLPKNVSDGIKALATIKDVYVASGQLARVFIVDDRVSMIPLTIATLRELLMIAAQWRVWVEDKYSKQKVPEYGAPTHTIVTAILDRGIYEDIPEILGIANGPIITYDEATHMPVFHVKTGFVPTEGKAGYYVHGEWDAPESKHTGHPHMTCEEAREILESPLGGFRFENQALGVAVVVATILTQFMRPMIKGPVPAIFVKSAKGSAGKTLLSRYIYAVAFGTDCPIKNIPIDTSKQKVDKKEFANALAADAFSRQLMSVYDNCDVEIGGDYLEMFLTTTDVKIRLFHTQKDAFVKWLMTLIFNGNEPELVGNVARRLLRVQLLHNTTEKFELGTENQFIRAIKKPSQRGVFIEAILTIVQSFFDSIEHIEGSDETIIHDVYGNEIHAKYWPSFGDWSQWVPLILRHAGFADPLEARILDEEADDETRQDALSVMSLVELLIRENDKRIRKPLVKMTGRSYSGIRMDDLIDHCNDLNLGGASRKEYEEGWRVLLKGVESRERKKVDSSFVKPIVRRIQELKLKELSADLSIIEVREREIAAGQKRREIVRDKCVPMRFVMGRDRSKHPVVAVVPD